MPLRDVGLNPGLGRSPGEGHDNPLLMNREVWRATVRRVTQESDTTEATYHTCKVKYLKSSANGWFSL